MPHTWAPSDVLLFGPHRARIVNPVRAQVRASRLLTAALFAGIFVQTNLKASRGKIDQMDNAIAEDACASLIESLKEDAQGADAPVDGIEDYVRDLFAKYFAASQQKQEPAEKAAPKIAKIIAKQARKKFVPEPEPEPQAEPADTPDGPLGQVTGKTTGIDRKIMNILTEVSAFYGEPVAIISGQRTQAQQAQAMYTNWQSHLRRGKENAWIAKNEKLRLQLDELKQDKNKNGFIDLLNKKADWKLLSNHLTGDEVDLAAATDPNIVAALATCLNHRAGRNSEGTRCHHFDNTRVQWPIVDSTRQKWVKE